MLTLAVISGVSIVLGACVDDDRWAAAEGQGDRYLLSQQVPAEHPVATNAPFIDETQGAARAPSENYQQVARPFNAAPASPINLPGNGVRMQRVEILDRQGFDRPMVAATAMIPVGWQAKGGVVWTPSACGNGYTFKWSASSPDGNRGIALFPGEQWSWSNFPVSGLNCPTMQVSSLKQYLQNLIKRARPGARIIDYRPREDLAKSFQQLNNVMPMAGGELRSWVEAGEILVGYTNTRGVEIRETAAAVAFFNLTRMTGIDGHVMETLSAQTLPGFASYAPNGQLNFKADETMRKAIQTAPEWKARISSHDAAIAKTSAAMAKDNNETYRNIAKINADGARQRSALMAKTSAEISDMQMDSWKKKNELWDKQIRETGEMINEVETYDDPQSSTGAVQLSHNYDNAWRLDDGTYVLTDDANFQPYKDTGQFGQKLKVQE